MTTKLLTPTQKETLQEIEKAFRNAHNDIMRNKRRDAEERIELKKVTDDLMMGWSEV